jgi:hypothetical protein
MLFIASSNHRFHLVTTPTGGLKGGRRDTWVVVVVGSFSLMLVTRALVENMVKKEPWLFSHCGSFDNRDLQSPNE